MQALATQRPARGLHKPHRAKQLVPVISGFGRHSTSAAQAEPGSGAALTTVEAAAPLGGTSTSTAPAATPLAPASDLASRQLRLLPWQTSSSQEAGSTTAAGEAQVARRASGSAASTSGRSPTSNGKGSKAQQLWQANRAGPHSAAAVCEACGGRRFLLTPAGVQPCMACQAWRQRPDCRPSDGPLLSVGDLNLAALDGSVDDNSSGSSNSSSSSEPRRRPRRKTGPMSAERREAISRGLKSKGAKSEEHKRSIARAMREAHARNPQLRHASAGRQKRCGHCGEVGHNRKTCPQLVAAQAERLAEQGLPPQDKEPKGGRQQRLASPEPPPASRVIVIEEVDDAQALPPTDLATAAAAAASSNGGRPDAAISTAAQNSLVDAQNGEAAATSRQQTLPAEEKSSASAPEDKEGTAAQPPLPPPQKRQPLQQPQRAAEPSAVLAGAAPHPFNEVLQQGRWLAPGFSLSADGSWIFQLPQSKEECVSQAAQAVLRAWDDGVRRQAVELLLPQGQPTEDGGWPGGIRQQFRVAKPMVESLLLRLKQHSGLEGRITAELLDEGDCVAAWQSERLGAVLFPTADTLPDLRKIDDALSGERLTLMINPQWQPQGQVISDFGFGRARKAAERFVAAFEEVYYLRRVRVFGDDVRILRCYPGGWQVHYVPPPPEPGSGLRAEPPVLLACEDGKPTFQRLIGLLKGVQGSRASKSWLDRFLTSSMGTFNEFAAYNSSQGQEAHSRGPGAATASPSAPAGAAAQSGPQPLRDIVTGEILTAGDNSEAAAASDLPSSSAAAAAGDTAGSSAGPQQGAPVPGTRPVGGSASSKLGVQPPRDIRLEPVQQIASWLGSSSPPSGTPPRQQPEQGSGSSGRDST